MMLPPEPAKASLGRGPHGARRYRDNSFCSSQAGARAN